MRAPLATPRTRSGAPSPEHTATNEYHAAHRDEDGRQHQLRRDGSSGEGHRGCRRGGGTRRRGGGSRGLLRLGGSRGKCTPRLGRDRGRRRGRRGGFAGDADVDDLGDGRARGRAGACGCGGQDRRGKRCGHCQGDDSERPLEPRPRDGPQTLAHGNATPSAHHRHASALLPGMCRNRLEGIDLQRTHLGYGGPLNPSNGATSSQRGTWVAHNSGVRRRPAATHDASHGGSVVGSLRCRRAPKIRSPCTQRHSGGKWRRDAGGNDDGQTGEGRVRRGPTRRGRSGNAPMAGDPPILPEGHGGQRSGAAPR